MSTLYVSHSNSSQLENKLLRYFCSYSFSAFLQSVSSFTFKLNAYKTLIYIYIYIPPITSYIFRCLLHHLQWDQCIICSKTVYILQYVRVLASPQPDLLPNVVRRNRYCLWKEGSVHLPNCKSFLVKSLKGSMSGNARDFNNNETRPVINFFFPPRQGTEGNSLLSDRNISETCTIVCHRQKLGGPL